MRVLSRVCLVISWIVFVISLFVQGLLILTFTIGGELIGKGRATNEVNERALPFVIVGTVLFAVGFLLFCFLRRWRWGWYAAAVVGALVLAGVGLYLKVSYPETILTGGAIAGYYSAFKLVWRHMLPLVAALTLLLWQVFRHAAESRQMRKEAVKDIKDEGFKPRFD